MPSTFAQRFLQTFNARVDRLVQQADANGNGYITLKEAKKLGDIEDSFLTYRKEYGNSDPKRFAAYLKEGARFVMTGGGEDLVDNIAAFRAYETGKIGDGTTDGSSPEAVAWNAFAELVGTDYEAFAVGELIPGMAALGISCQNIARDQAPDFMDAVEEAVYEAAVQHQASYLETDASYDNAEADEETRKYLNMRDFDVAVITLDGTGTPIGYSMSASFKMDTTGDFTFSQSLVRFDGTALQGNMQSNFNGTDVRGTFATTES